MSCTVLIVICVLLYSALVMSVDFCRYTYCFFGCYTESIFLINLYNKVSQILLSRNKITGIRWSPQAGGFLISITTFKKGVLLSQTGGGFLFILKTIFTHRPKVQASKNFNKIDPAASSTIRTIINIKTDCLNHRLFRALETFPHETQYWHFYNTFFMHVLGKKAKIHEL